MNLIVRSWRLEYILAYPIVLLYFVIIKTSETLYNLDFGLTVFRKLLMSWSIWRASQQRDFSSWPILLWRYLSLLTWNWHLPLLPDTLFLVTAYFLALMSSLGVLKLSFELNIVFLIDSLVNCSGCNICFVTCVLLFHNLPFTIVVTTNLQFILPITPLSWEN